MTPHISELNFGPAIVLGLLGLAASVLIFLKRQELTRRIQGNWLMGPLLAKRAVQGMIWAAVVLFAVVGTALLILVMVVGANG